MALCALPFGLLVRAAVSGGLGANPADRVADETGLWALRFLLVALAATPCQRLLGWRLPLANRRVLGLAAFGYAALHLLAYLWLDQFFRWRDILADLVERPFISAGMAAFLCLVPLAATSWNGAVRRLGWRRWQRLHRLVYLAAGLAVLHFWWLVKADVREPLIYALLLALLLVLRALPMRRAGRQPRSFRNRIATRRL